MGNGPSACRVPKSALLACFPPRRVRKPVPIPGLLLECHLCEPVRATLFLFSRLPLRRESCFSMHAIKAFVVPRALALSPLSQQHRQAQAADRGSRSHASSTG
jgi:hypothetical protein